MSGLCVTCEFFCSTTTNPTLEISVRCKCPVGVRTRYIFPSWEMQRVDRDISEAEHGAVNHWNDLVEERKKEADDGRSLF